MPHAALHLGAIDDPKNRPRASGETRCSPQDQRIRTSGKQGDFANTSAESVAQLVGASSCVIRKGFIPTTFAGLESARICFAHIDVDIYRSHIDCLEFIWPRVVRGGFLLFDDYGMPTCPGARTAVDEFFAGRSTVPFCLANGQAIAFKSDA